MTGGRLLAGAAASTFALAGVLGAAPAYADDQPHFFNNDPSIGWTHGCTLTYSLTPEAAEYAPYAQAAYAAIGGPTNFAFTRLPDGDPAANIRISVTASIPEDAAGWGSTSGEVQLRPVADLPDWQNEATNNNIRTNLVAHESLHVLGLDHDANMLTPEESEIMYPILPTGPLTFGPSDLAALGVLKAQNHCISPGVQDPAFTSTAEPTASADIPTTTVVIQTMSKARCKKLHGKWTAGTHTCFYIKVR